MRDGVINEDRPEQREEHDRRELHALSDGTDDQGWRDRRKHGLEKGEGPRSDARLIGARLRSDPCKAQVLGAAKDMPEERTLEALTKDQGIAAGPPEQEAHGRERDALGRDGEDVLGSDQATVEHEEPRDAHQQNQGGTDQHPSVVSCSDGGGGDRNEHSANY